MDPTLSQPTEREVMKATTLLPVLSAYFIAVGSLYLWGFWDSFGINIMEYLGLSDVVKVAAWPVGSAFVFLLVGLLMGDVAPGGRLPEGGGRDTRVGRWLNKYRSALTWVVIVIVGALLASGSPTGLQVVAVIGGVMLAAPVRRLAFFEKLVPDYSVRSSLAVAAVVLPLWAFGQGRVNADAIKSGHDYLYALPGTDGISLTGDPQTTIRYVGYAGSTFFFWDPTVQGLMVVPSSSVKVLKLAKKPRVSRALWDQITNRK